MFGHPEFDLFKAIHATRAMRRLKTDPVPREIIMKVIEAATMSPSNLTRRVVELPNGCIPGAKC